MRNMKKKKKIIIILFAVGIVVLAAVGSYFFIKYQKYDYMELTKLYENNNSDNANYKQCLDGVLKYNRDGIALLTEKGEEIWKQSCQMSHPVVDVCGDSVAVADKGGTSIMVFQKKGLKGEFQTTRPIEKFSVSSKGIVSAILKDEEAPLVMCYDAVGNVLVEHVVSLTTMGYPMDVAISPNNGDTQIVSYLHMEDNVVKTKVAYYYFGNEDSDNKQVLQREFEGTVMPMVSFLNNQTSALIADNAIYIYKGLDQLEEIAKIKIANEIQSVECGEGMIAVLTKKESNSEYKLHIYNHKGKEVTSISVDAQYAKMNVADGKILLFDGQMCSIYNQSGICKFQGNMEENILEIFPVRGFNKYMVISASGFREMQLAK